MEHQNMSGSSQDSIFYGPETDFDVFSGSVAQYMYQAILKHPMDTVIEINGETGEKQTLEEILTLALSVGQGLRERGLHQGDVILLAADHSVHTNAVVLGAILHNIVIFPINPTCQTYEYEHYLQLKEPKVVICEIKCLSYIIEALSKLKLTNVPIFILDDEDVMTGRNVTKLSNILCHVDLKSYTPPPVSNPEVDVILILSSSGTTGLPKGVMITHRNLCYQTQCQRNIFRVVSKQLFLQITPLAWVTGIFNTITSYAFGMPRVYIGNVSGPVMLRAIQEYKTQWLMSIPTLLSIMVNDPNFDKYDLSSVSLIISGGSHLPSTIANKILSRWPGPPIINQLYGMTEMSGVITVTIPDQEAGSVGRLGMGIMMKVTDIKTGTPLGANQLGALVVKSNHTMMPGYISNPAATKEAFNEDGFYLTGDLGYISEDDQLFIAERMKDIIQVKYLRLNPSELENIIMGMEGVEDVGVVGVPSPDGYNHPVALVVKKVGAEVTQQQIVDHVAGKVSKHKHLQGGVRFVDAIPRNTNGKMMRMKLQQLVME